MKKPLFRVAALVLAAVMFLSSAVAPTCCAVKGVGGQNQIVEPTPLLDEKGCLTESGYCYTPLYQYDRSAIKAGASRIKEWDFYQISNEKYTMQITIADISLGAAVTVGIFDMTTGESFSTMILNLFTFGKFTKFSASSVAPHEYSFQRRNFDFKLKITDAERTIKFKGKANGADFNVDMVLKNLENHESYIAAVPFDTRDGKHFYFNEKTNCMAATGTVTAGGKNYEFKGLEDNSFAVLDWGRGVWPFHETWWWGNGSTKLENGDIFGFEIGWGYGNTKDVSENCLFLNGKAYKIGYLKLENEAEIVKPLSSDWVKSGKGMKWVIKSYDDEACTKPNNEFNMEMTPFYDNYTMLRIICVGNLCHQVFGKWNGTVTIDGKTIQIKDMLAFLERSDNMW